MYPTSPTLHVLPLEILTKILSQLNTTSLLSFARVSRFFYQIITEGVLLQYSLEKDKAGVEDRLSCVLSMPEKLKLLKERERAWRTLDYKFITNVKVDRPATLLYDLIPVAYILGCSPYDTMCTLQYTNLPRRKKQKEQWKILSIERPILDFGTAVEEHDLIAVACYRWLPDLYPQNLDILLRRFSDGTEHPHAQNSEIHVCEIESGYGLPSLVIEISGENLVMCVEYDRTIGGPCAVMYVYNWKSGTLKFKPRPISNAGIVFLRHDIFIHPNAFLVSLDAYYIPPSEPGSSPCPEKRELWPFKILILPRVSSDMQALTFMCRGDPGPQDPSSPPPPPSSLSSFDTEDTGSESSLEKPFQNRVEDALLLFTLDLYHVLDVTLFVSFAFVAHRDRLLNVVLPSLAPFMQMSEEERRNLVTLNIRKFDLTEGMDFPFEFSESITEVPAEDTFELLSPGSHSFGSTSMPLVQEESTGCTEACDDSELISSTPFIETHFDLAGHSQTTSETEAGNHTNEPLLGWSYWGPDITRWFANDDVLSEYITTTSGSRYVRLTNPGSLRGGSKHIEILDFGRNRVRECDFRARLSGKGRSLAQTAEGEALADSNWTLVTEPSTIDYEAFEEPITSCLPYIYTVSRETFDYHAVLMDEERIIGLKDAGEVKSFDVLYFG